MYIYITLVVLPVVTSYVRCESTSDLPKEVQQKSTLKSSVKDFSSTIDPLNISLIKQPLKSYFTTGNLQRQRLDEKMNNGLSRTSSQLTKLAKTLSLSFEPYFSKDYFEPFERRPRPLTLVAFRKNGLVPKVAIRRDEDKKKSLEVAVLQSPYNSIGYSWQDEPGEPEN